MQTENTYSLQDLADLAGVSPRTIRYYVAQGLLPSPGQVGPGAHYTDGHLARLRLIRRLQREHLPLAEIRARLASLDDDAIASLVEIEPPAPPEDSALEYVRAILGGEPSQRQWTADRASLIAPASKAVLTLGVPALRRRAVLAESSPLSLAEGEPAHPTEPVPDRSQWDRVALTPDIELHIRRPLSRQQNKQVERLITIARELLEEDPS